MRLKNKIVVAACGGLLLAAGGVSAKIHLNPFHHKPKQAPADDVAPTVAVPQITPAPPVAGSVQYDEVGYAVSGGGSGVTLSHATLPAPSFVEITNLDTGKTILAVVNAQQTAGRMIATLSPQALSQLGGASDQPLPVRIRRVDPPQQEQSALLAGQPAGERLDTPPMLLNPLKRKLAGTQGRPVASDGAAVVQTNPIFQKPVAQKPTIMATSAKPLVTTPKPHAAPKPIMAESVSESRFIVEDAGAPHRDVAAPAPKSTPKWSKPVPIAAETAPAPVSGAFYVQIASLSSEANAKALAAKIGMGASVDAVGSHWHVRAGPYANEAKAQAALGALATKGYRGAKITH